MNTEISGNFGINKRLGLKSHKSTERGHILEKKGSISYNKKGYKKRHIFPFSSKKIYIFFIFKGYIFLMLLLCWYIKRLK